MKRLETILDRNIEDVLRVGFESLDENEQTLFLHISIFFNYEDGDLVKTMFPDNYLDVKHGLKILESRCLIHKEISTYGERIVIHRLLQQMGKKSIHKQEPWNRHILVEATGICDVLEDDKGTRNVRGISFDISGIDELSLGKKAFRSLPNLLFLRVYKSKFDGNNTMHIPEEMEFPHRLRLLRWEAYPSKSLPPKFNPEYLVELSMIYSNVEYLWQGTQPLMKLKKLDLSRSFRLKGLPDLSKATNLEVFDICGCWSLEEIPSSFSHLHKLQKLEMSKCINLQVIPAHMNLASLEYVRMVGCSRLRKFPTMSTNIKILYMPEIAVEEVPPSIRLSSRLTFLDISSSGNLKGLAHLPTSLRNLQLTNSDIEWIPDCIKALHHLEFLDISGCRRLASLPELPCLLKSMKANDCESLDTVFYPLNTPMACLEFINCFKLSQQVGGEIIQQQSLGYWSSILPGREVPEEFDQRAKGNCLTIRPDDGNPYCDHVTVCVVISPNKQITEKTSSELLCCGNIAQEDGDPVYHSSYVGDVSKCQTEHLVIFDSRFLGYITDIMFEFSPDFDILECGAKLSTDESFYESYESGSDQVFEDESIQGGSYEEAFVEETDIVVYDSKEDIDCWSWLCLCFDLSNIVRNVGSLVSGKKTIEAGTNIVVVDGALVGSRNQY